MNLLDKVTHRYGLSKEISRLKAEYDQLGKEIQKELKDPEQKIGKFRVSSKIEPIRYWYNTSMVLNLSDQNMNLVEPVTSRVKDFFADEPEKLALLEDSKIPEGEKEVLRIVLYKHKLKKYDEDEVIKVIEEV